jgi:adenylate cyclase
MSVEIERKFLVINDSYRSLASACHEISQYYLCADPRATVRVRIYDDKAFLTVKSANVGATRGEWEYEIPVSEAREMIAKCCERGLSKHRYIVEYEGYCWEVDEFAGHLAGLVVAEIELPSEDASFATPGFIGKEVTGDRRYYNSVLSTATSIPD